MKNTALSATGIGLSSRNQHGKTLPEIKITLWKEIGKYYLAHMEDYRTELAIHHTCRAVFTNSQEQGGYVNHVLHETYTYIAY